MHAVALLLTAIDLTDRLCDSEIMIIRLRPRTNTIAVASLLSAVTMMTSLADTNAPVSSREANRAAVQKRYAADLKTYGSNTNMFVRSGLLANRTEKWVKIQAEATALRENDPCEFGILAENSGHDYEATAVSFAKPSDIHDALLFIGMKPGRPVDQNRHRFWPKGERVIVTAEWDNKKHYRTRMESLVINKSSGGTIPAEGFIFVGSVFRPSKDESSGKKLAYAADVLGPNCIMSYYNDQETVLDVPRLADQGEVYQSHYPNPEYPFTKGQPVEFQLKPENSDGKLRVLDLVLQFGIKPGTNAPASFSNAVVRLNDAAGNRLMQGNRMQDALAAFETFGRKQHDLCVRVEFDGALPLHVIHDISEFLSAIDTEAGIRIEPPPRGDPYYKAFLPDEKLRDSANRSVQPWELNVSFTNGGLRGRLTLTDDVVNKETGVWSTRTQHFEASTPDAVRTALSTRKDDGETTLGPPYLFIFAPRTMPFETLRPFIAASLDTRPVIYIYLD